MRWVRASLVLLLILSFSSCTKQRKAASVPKGSESGSVPQTGSTDGPGEQPVTGSQPVPGTVIDTAMVIPPPG